MTEALTTERGTHHNDHNHVAGSRAYSSLLLTHTRHVITAFPQVHYCIHPLTWSHRASSACRHGESEAPTPRLVTRPRMVRAKDGRGAAGVAVPTSWLRR